MRTEVRLLTFECGRFIVRGVRSFLRAMRRSRPGVEFVENVRRWHTVEFYVVGPDADLDAIEEAVRAWGKP